VDAEAATSWSRGYHVFRATPLREVVREVNRYAVRKIRIADLSLAELPVSGSFKVGDAQSIATALPATLPVRVVEQGGETILAPR
jgi:transmembrane sensor